MSLMIVLIVALTPGIMLISTTIPYTFQLLRVAGCSFQWPLLCHSQLCNFLPETQNAVLSLQLSHSHLDSLPRSVLLLWLSLMDCCHELRVHYPHIIILEVDRITQLFAKPMKEAIPEVFLNLTCAQHCRYSCWTTFIATSNQFTYTVTFSVFPCWYLYTFCIKISKDALVPYTHSNLFSILSLTLGLVDLDIKPG